MRVCVNERTNERAGRQASKYSRHSKHAEGKQRANEQAKLRAGRQPRNEQNTTNERLDCDVLHPSHKQIKTNETGRKTTQPQNHAPREETTETHIDPDNHNGGDRDNE